MIKKQIILFLIYFQCIKLDFPSGYASFKYTNDEELEK